MNNSVALKLIAPAPAQSVISKIFDDLGKAEGFVVRPSQITLADQVSRTLSYTTGKEGAPGAVCVLEAPTGTGKTLGYLAGALQARALALARGEEALPIVISTATIGLQDQIMVHDIPRLAAVGALDARDVAVAKGRGRYFCPHTAGMLEKKAAADSQFDMFDVEKEVTSPGQVIALDMLHKWREKSWNGERDTWTSPMPDCWAACAASSETCVGRACDHYSSCAYMKSRQKLATASVIVANHDIVLADLSQRNEARQAVELGESRPTTTVLPAKKYQLIVDEAHNLPEKAAALKEAVVPVGSQDWLLELKDYEQAAMRFPKVARAVSATKEANWDVMTTGALSVNNVLTTVGSTLERTVEFSGSGLYSWGLSAPDVKFLPDLAACCGHLHTLEITLSTVARSLSDMAQDAVGAAKGMMLTLLNKTTQYLRKAKQMARGLDLFLGDENVVRWVFQNRKNEISLHCQPMEGADVLEDLLWKSGISVAMVSATLQICGSFDRFKARAGLPASAVVQALPTVFDYSRGYLHRPYVECAPGEFGYDKELTSNLERLFKQSPAKGFLVLFTSQASMDLAVRSFSPALREVALVQGTAPIADLVKHHKAVIDEGHRSVLVGLASMAEGLDLPGAYCEHVVVTRLPFSVPTHPVEEARKAALGSKWFDVAYISDMITKLIQAAGRLIRRESDWGIVTILDNRLSKKYGLKVISALPNFLRGTKLADFALPKTILATAKAAVVSVAQTVTQAVTQAVRAVPKLSIVPSAASKSIAVPALKAVGAAISGAAKVVKSVVSGGSAAPIEVAAPVKKPHHFSAEEREFIDRIMKKFWAMEL